MKGAIVLIVIVLLNTAKVLNGWLSPEVTNLAFYIHTNSSGSNATAVVVAGQNGDLVTEQFGTVSVGDLLLTEEESENSTLLGRLKIMVLNADQTSSVYPHAQETMTAVIDTALYNGTIAIAGRDIAHGSELAVLGGTGYFDGVKGWAIFTHVYINPPDSITLVNATLFHSPSESFVSDLYEDDEAQQIPEDWSSFSSS